MGESSIVGRSTVFPAQYCSERHPNLEPLSVSSLPPTATAKATAWSSFPALCAAQGDQARWVQVPGLRGHLWIEDWPWGTTGHYQGQIAAHSTHLKAELIE